MGEEAEAASLQYIGVTPIPASLGHKNTRFLLMSLKNILPLLPGLLSGAAVYRMTKRREINSYHKETPGLIGDHRKM